MDYTDQQKVCPGLQCNTPVVSRIRVIIIRVIISESSYQSHYIRVVISESSVSESSCQSHYVGIVTNLSESSYPVVMVSPCGQSSFTCRRQSSLRLSVPFVSPVDKRNRWLFGIVIWNVYLEMVIWKSHSEPELRPYYRTGNIWKSMLIGRFNLGRVLFVD